MIARTAEELMLSCPRLHVSGARKIMEEHSFEPCVVWGRETGELLVEMVNQEVICRVDDDGRVNTKALIEWMGY